MSSVYCFSIFILGLLTGLTAGQRFLAVENGEFRLNEEKVFLSGMNLAWHNFGMDFGDGRYTCCNGAALEDYLRQVSEAGGNSMRIWLHCGGDNTPAFDTLGYVMGTDYANTMTSDLATFLDVAYQYDVLVFIVLWNGAVLPNSFLVDMFYDDSKLQSYIDKALVPMVTGLQDKVALGGWEIINEPEGLVYTGQSNSNPCFDTTPLTGSGAGWVNTFTPMENLLRFINLQTSAIKQADPKVLVTLGSWNERAQTDSFNYRNYYTDSCLIAAGGMSDGVIDFQQMHTYAWDEAFSDTSPFSQSNPAYQLSKPNVIGEFSQDGGDGRDITTMYEWAYSEGYSGAWSWQANGSGENSDDFDTQARGLERIRDRNDQNLGGRVNIDLQ